MERAAGWNLYVFRDGRRVASGRRLCTELLADLRSGPGDDEALTDVLIRSGELECGLADAGHLDASLVAAITDRLASALIGDARRGLSAHCASTLDAVRVPECLALSPHEGFAYYALHPLDFAALVQRMPLASPRIAVVGIRSIGTTLSAVVAAAANRRGVRADRLTVRPKGHPYGKQLRLGSVELAWVRSRLLANACFWVVDEGPGMSGSSFLSVAEALEEAGVAAERIELMCSRPVNPDDLVAHDASRRFRRFRSHAVRPAVHLPSRAGICVEAGRWRERVYNDPSSWPSSWSQMERLKYVSRDGSELLKFEGFGHYGAGAIRRASLLSARGFGPRARRAEAGFVGYALLDGRPLRRADLSPALLDRLARYCALRADEFSAGDVQTGEIAEMARHNAEVMLGRELVLPLEVVRPTFADGRMMPSKWVATKGGGFLKIDGATHGDDHFLPGPTDVAWDLAGVVVEWRLDRQARDYFLERYRSASGDDAAGRLLYYLAAYALFRLGYSAMAAEAMRGSAEAERLLADVASYRSVAENLCRP